MRRFLNRVINRDSFWLALCTISLVAYMVRSVSVRAFGREVSRLVGKFCG